MYSDIASGQSFLSSLMRITMVWMVTRVMSLQSLKEAFTMIHVHSVALSPIDTCRRLIFVGKFTESCGLRFLFIALYIAYH